METGLRTWFIKSNFVMKYEHWIVNKVGRAFSQLVFTRQFASADVWNFGKTSHVDQKQQRSESTRIVCLRNSSSQLYNPSKLKYFHLRRGHEMENLLNVIGWLLSIVTATGNCFVIFVVAKNRRLYSSANLFVLSLAVADFGVGIAVFPSSYFCNYSTACNSRVFMAFFWFFLHSSVTNLCSLTWDRYIAIVHPLIYNTSMTERRPGIVILTSWFISFAISLSLFVGMYATTSKTALKVLRLTGVSAFDMVFCALLFYAVVRILAVARAQSHQEAEETAIELQLSSNVSSTPPESAENFRRHRKHNTSRFIIALVVFFLGCYVVVSCLVLCITFSCRVSDNASQMLVLLLVLNSAVNPIVYAFLKSDIKKEIKRLVGRGNNRDQSADVWCCISLVTLSMLES